MRESTEPVDNAVEKNSFHLEGLTMRRDLSGVIHVTGAPVEAFGCCFDDEMNDAPVFCLHDPDGECPGDAESGVFQYGSWFRGWVTPDAMVFRG